MRERDGRGWNAAARGSRLLSGADRECRFGRAEALCPTLPPRQRMWSMKAIGHQGYRPCRRRCASWGVYGYNKACYDDGMIIVVIEVIGEFVDSSYIMG